MSLNFLSDNETPIAASIMEAIVTANQGAAHAYAEDEWSAGLDEAFSNLFRRPSIVLPVSTGTAANAIALAVVTPPWGSVYCHTDAHIQNDESGAPEFFGNGLRLVPMKGKEGKLELDTLQQTIHATQGHGVHSYKPAALSLTQSTESGTVYTHKEIITLCDFARSLGMKTHMDGARFANAVASLGCHPAEISCEAGIDMLSFGASKNGCMAAEALVIFGNEQWRATAERHRKRAGHLLSKMRYISAQLLAYLKDDNWLKMAGHANRLADLFAQAVADSSTASLEYPVQANEVFVKWGSQGFDHLEAQGIQFQMWPGRDDLARFVFGHSTSNEETRVLIDTMSSFTPH